jgi:hypothetical protein
LWHEEVHSASTGARARMKRDQLEKNIGWRVKIAPPAIHLDPTGRELPPRTEDWIIVEVTNAEVRIEEAAGRRLTTILGTDAVASFTSDPSRSTPGNIPCGLLLLKVQMYIQGDKITFAPCLRPGARVPPQPVHIVEQQVDTQYPVTSGMQQRLEAAGYRVRWSAVSRVATLEREGWEVVVESDQHGMPTKYYVITQPENLVYVKTREPDLQVLVNNPYYCEQPGLVSLTVDAATRALVFQFDSPQSAYAFCFRMGRDPNGTLCCTMARGRVDTVVGTLTEAGKRALSQLD